MHSLVVVAQQEKMKHELLITERESQHAKEIEELWKAHVDQAKLCKEECKMMMAKIPTPKEKQQENNKKQQENSKKSQEQHQMMTKSPENNKEETMDAEEHDVAQTQHTMSIEAVDALVMIREHSTTFDDLQVKTPIKEQKPTTKKKRTKKQEKYKKDKERTSKLLSNKVHYDLLTYNAWDKKRRHKYSRTDPFRFDPRYKKQKKPYRKYGTIAVLQQKKKHVDTLIHNVSNKKKRKKKKHK